MNWQTVLSTPISETNLKTELTQVAAHLDQAIYELATLKVRLKRAEMELKYTRSFCDVLARAEFDKAYPTPEKRRAYAITEDRIANSVETSDEVQAAVRAYLDADEAHTLASALADALVKRKDILVSLAGLSRSELEALHVAT